MAKGSEAIYSSGQTMVSYYNRTGIGQRRTMNTMANKGIMCQSTMGQDIPFGPKRTRKFQVINPRHGPLLRGSEWKHVEASGRRRSQWEAVEDSGRGRSRAEASGRSGRGRKRSRRGQEGPEEVGKAVGVGRRGQEGPEEVRKAVGEDRRGGKAWGSNGEVLAA